MELSGLAGLAELSELAGLAGLSELSWSWQSCHGVVRVVRVVRVVKIVVVKEFSWVVKVIILTVLSGLSWLSGLLLGPGLPAMGLSVRLSELYCTRSRPKRSIFETDQMSDRTRRRYQIRSAARTEIVVARQRVARRHVTRLFVTWRDARST